MNSGLNDKWHSICRPLKLTNRLKYRLDTTTRAKINLLPVFKRHLEFRGEGITSEGWRENR